MKHLNLSRNPNARFPDSIADVRGFEVRSRDMDEKLGKVDDVIHSSDGRIRYLDVDLGGFFNPKHVALPIGIGLVDRVNDVIWLTGVNKRLLEELPEYDGDPDGITDEYESTLRRIFVSGTSGNADLDLYDQGRFYAERGGSTARDARLILFEEELNAGKRQVRSGEDEIRIPVTAEEADLRRERLGESGRREVSDVNATTRKARGVADKLADKADDLKDRVDANPASKPGPDRTDRPERRY